ncbi:PucR family transcriptional regulator [Streptomyces viridosporus]|uniref:PucR family transcriptional regulator n=2 Tax=Streptomyces viridosporus TaxID=67581 RepID=A0ABX6AGI9_STRVD|nr:PucR family transcriptional regulator [Streptomyces viridosporus]QEU86913.1 PucR family transcriptional regulator [Streptomyces viridosporus T7A]
MPTLDVLVRALGDDLAPVSPAAPPPRRVTGVHISELADPTPYLSGGELLLTTGLGPAGGRTMQARAYTARLAAHGVTALGIGLGPVHDTVPEALAGACEAAGLPLLVVPPPTPFLTVARTYWSLVAAAGREELSTALGAHRELVRSAAGPDPVPAVVRALADAVEGWAARLSPDGEVMEVWPRRHRTSARRAATEVARLRVAGPYSSATFPLGEDDVVLQPLTGHGRLTGFVATGCPRPMKAPDRQLVLTACALLALQGQQQRRGVAAARAARACVARLLCAGHVDAARALAADLGLPALPPRVRLLGLAGFGHGRGDDVLDAVEPAARDGGQLLAVAEPDEVWILVGPDDAQTVPEAARRYVAAHPSAARAALGAEADLGQLRWQLPPLRRLLAGVPAGTLHDRGDGGVPAAPSLEPLLSHRRADLVGTVAAYLRHRGHWERAAADLGVHRNTLRHRIGTAGRLLGADLDDPDVASRTWLALRENGLA